MTHWVVHATLTAPPDKEGHPIQAVLEAHDIKREDQAYWFGRGQLRGMGYSVKDVRVKPA